MTARMTSPADFQSALRRMQTGCARAATGSGTYIEACAEAAAEMVAEVHAGYAHLAGGGCTDAQRLVVQERARQEGLWPGSTCAGQLSHGAKLAVLLEEVGEVAHEMTEAMNATGFLEEANRDNLRTELVQVAAVACAWVESLLAEEVTA